MPKKKLLIVESPTKAKTINQFVDSSYKVMACMGHIRDLPESAKDIPEKYKKKKSWKNLGVNVDKDFEPIYCIPKSKTKIVQNLKKEIHQAKELILATDEDREGESISWHLFQILKPKIPVKRIVFHEITKSAIQKALQNYRPIDKGLVQAQEARRVLDRLVGYTISPLLWKKIATKLSAGRVQSVAVKLISEREIERMNFVKTSYSHIEAKLSSSKKETFSSHLYSWKLKKLASAKDFNSKGQLKNNKLLHLKEPEAKQILKQLKQAVWTVHSVDKKPISRTPKPPFITSTLQQAASRNLNLSPRQTMAIAQKLYEKGLITYMRTDSTSLSNEAITGIRRLISKIYGKNELPKNSRIYKTKSKGAQEAHEAIRPAGQDFKPPEKIGLAGEEFKLYQLIWQRTIACQMKNCEQEQTSVKIQAGEGLFTSSGLRIVSPGFYRVYKDQKDEDLLLPHLKKGQNLKCLQLTQKTRETQPPFRYNEASLIQKLEAEGVGRPSTYAPIITTIQERGYVKKKNKNLAPTFTALAVTKLLSEHLSNYVDLGFTSKMEDSLDDIAIGKTDSIQYLNSIYKGQTGLEQQVKKREKTIDNTKSRTLQFKMFEDTYFHVGRFGAYVTQNKGKKELKASLPEELFLSDLTLKKLEEILQSTQKKEHILGIDPLTKQRILIKTGPFGPYLEQGIHSDETKQNKTQKTKSTKTQLKRVSIPKFLSPETLTLKQGLKLLELPKTLGVHPKTKKEIKKNIGRFGPYVVHDGDFRSVPSDESFLSLDLKEALKILAQEKKGKGKTTRQKRKLKEFTHNKQPLTILQGYSPYIRFKNKNYSLPKDTNISKLSLKEALEIIEKTSKKTPKKKALKKKKGKK